MTQIEYWEKKKSKLDNVFNYLYYTDSDFRETLINNKDFLEVKLVIEKSNNIINEIIEDLQPSLDDDQYTSVTEMNLSDEFHENENKINTIVEKLEKILEEKIENDYNNMIDKNLNTYKKQL